MDKFQMVLYANPNVSIPLRAIISEYFMNYFWESTTNNGNHSYFWLGNSN